MSESWKAVFWDIGGVILDADSIQRGRALFVASLAVKFDLDTTDAIEVWDRELGTYFREREGNTYAPAHEGYQQTIETVVGGPVSVDQWLPLVIQTGDVGFQPVPGAIETLKVLADEGYYLAVISDMDAWEAEFILTLLNVRKYFGHVTTSAEVGRTKPAPVIFETALQKASIPPEQALFVGDRYENDMLGGKQAGLWTVAFGGSAAKKASEDGSTADYVIDDPRDLLTILGVE